MSDIQNHVQSIVNNLENPNLLGLNSDGEQFSAFDYLQDALDIEYIVNNKGEYLGARVLVAFGGPNIWVDTRRNVVEGAWWDESFKAGFTDNLGLDDACAELWNCR